MKTLILTSIILLQASIALALIGQPYSYAVQQWGQPTVLDRKNLHAEWRLNKDGVRIRIWMSNDSKINTYIVDALKNENGQPAADIVKIRQYGRPHVPKLQWAERPAGTEFTFAGLTSTPDSEHFCWTSPATPLGRFCMFEHTGQDSPAFGILNENNSRLYYEGLR